MGLTDGVGLSEKLLGEFNACLETRITHPAGRPDHVESISGPIGRHRRAATPD